MHKPNIKHFYSTHSLDVGARHRMLRSVSPAVGASRLRLTAHYDNINLVNHLPFADKSQQDVLTDKERFKTFYQKEQAIAAHRQSGSQLLGTVRTNNQKNKIYKKNLLEEHHRLG